MSAVLIRRFFVDLFQSRLQAKQVVSGDKNHHYRGIMEMIGFYAEALTWRKAQNMDLFP